MYSAETENRELVELNIQMLKNYGESMFSLFSGMQSLLMMSCNNCNHDS